MRTAQTGISINLRSALGLSLAGRVRANALREGEATTVGATVRFSPSGERYFYVAGGGWTQTPSFPLDPIPAGRSMRWAMNEKQIAGRMRDGSGHLTLRRARTPHGAGHNEAAVVFERCHVGPSRWCRSSTQSCCQRRRQQSFRRSA